MFAIAHALPALLLILAIQGLTAAPARAGDTASASAESMERLSTEERMALAGRYEHAEGVPRNYAKAMDLYCAAARMGHAPAQYAIGWMHAHGRGMEKDDGIARHFFELAARQGHEQAREMLRYLPADNATSMTSPCIQLATADDTATLPEPDYPRGHIYDLVHRLAPRYEIDPQLALAIIRVESAFNARAVSPKNAQGLMQLMPDTAKRFRVRNPFDPEDNIKGGLSYLRWLLGFFQGNVPLVAAAYNAGERAVENHRGIPPMPRLRITYGKLCCFTENSRILSIAIFHRMSRYRQGDLFYFPGGILAVGVSYRDRVKIA